MLLVSLLNVKSPLLIKSLIFGLVTLNLTLFIFQSSTSNSRISGSSLVFNLICLLMVFKAFNSLSDFNISILLYILLLYQFTN